MAIPKPVDLQLPAITDPNDAARVARQLMDRMDAGDEQLRKNLTVAVVGNPITIEKVPSADRWASKQIANAVNGAQNWVDGVQRPSADFKAAGLAAAGKWKARTQEAIQGDRFAKALAKVNVDEAIATAVAVGGAGFAAGIQAREAKIRRTVADLQPRVAAVKAAVDAMPQDTEAQRDARALAAIKGMREVGKSRKG